MKSSHLAAWGNRWLTSIYNSLIVNELLIVYIYFFCRFPHLKRHIKEILLRVRSKIYCLCFPLTILWFCVLHLPLMLCLWDSSRCWGRQCFHYQKYSIVCIYFNLLIFCKVDGQLDCFQFGIIRKNAAKSILVHLFCISFYSTWMNFKNIILNFWRDYIHYISFL